MKLMAGILVAAAALFVAPAPASAQDGNQELKKKLLDEISKKLDEEMKRILEEISKLIDDEIAKARGQKPSDRQMPPPAAPSGKTGFLGVQPDQEQPEAEDFEAWKVDGGIRINVMPGGPAEKSGLKDGDVIVAVASTKIIEWTDLQGAMRSRKPGDKVTIKVMRGKESKEIAVTLGERPEPQAPPADDEPAPAPAPKPEGPRAGRLGLQPGEATGKGLAIVDVSPDTPAQKAGIKAGDILVKLDDTAIWKVADLQAFMDKAKAGQKVVVTVLRDGQEKKFTTELMAK